MGLHVQSQIPPTSGMLVCLPTLLHTMLQTQNILTHELPVNNAFIVKKYVINLVHKNTYISSVFIIKCS
jgi:hypothetical protein